MTDPPPEVAARSAVLQRFDPPPDALPLLVEVTDGEPLFWVALDLQARLGDLGDDYYSVTDPDTLGHQRDSLPPGSGIRRTLSFRLGHVERLDGDLGTFDLEGLTLGYDFGARQVKVATGKPGRPPLLYTLVVAALQQAALSEYPELAQEEHQQDLRALLAPVLGPIFGEERADADDPNGDLAGALSRTYPGEALPALRRRIDQPTDDERR